MKEINRRIAKKLEELFPDAHCELIHHNAYELLIAVVLSAQTTDQRVNSVTPVLFGKYPDAKSLAESDPSIVEDIIKPIGLYHNKTKAIRALADDLVKRFDGEVPSRREDLESLRGVGRKSANVILSNCFDTDAFAVDTHVARVSRRLGLAEKDDDVLTIEKKLMKAFPQGSWGKLHHQFIFFGRYLCKARNPECERCPFGDICRKDYLL